jgi:mRNA-degrading endonuclease toxin of MazEF toxin-antitoxin module
MLTSGVGEVVLADLGEPVGREAGFPRPVVVVTAQVVLAQRPNLVHVVPVTTTRRGFRSEIDLGPDEDDGLTEPSPAGACHLDRPPRPARPPLAVDQRASWRGSRGRLQRCSSCCTL